MKPEDKRKELLRMLATLDQERIGTSEFIEALERIITYINSIDERNVADFEMMKEAIAELVAKHKEENVNDLAGFKEEARDLFKSLIQNVEERQRAVEERVASLRDGKDADEERVIQEVVNRIKLPEQKEVILDSPEELRAKLLTLDDGQPFEVSNIAGLEELIKRLTAIENRPVINGGIIGRDLIKDIDLSASLDGVTTTFNLPAVWNIVSVHLDSYPYGALRKGIDYTWTQTSITFTSNIDPATQLATGQKCILTVVS